MFVFVSETGRIPSGCAESKKDAATSGSLFSAGGFYQDAR